jgi:hypothetical protein
MKKIIRLNEGDLSRIVKRVISEQASGQFDAQVSKFIKDVAAKLVNKAICAEDSDDGYNYDCYFMDSLKEEPTYLTYDTNAKNVMDIKQVNIGFRGRFFPQSEGGSNLQKMSIEFGINLDKGVPVSISRTFVWPEKGELISLDDAEVSRKTIPLIKGVRMTKPVNPCFTGFRYNSMIMSNIPGVPGGQHFSKSDSKGNETILYKGKDWNSGRGVIIPYDVESPGVKEKHFTWACVNGKLTTKESAAPVTPKTKNQLSAAKLKDLGFKLGKDPKTGYQGYTLTKKYNVKDKTGKVVGEVTNRVWVFSNPKTQTWNIRVNNLSNKSLTGKLSLSQRFLKKAFPDRTFTERNVQNQSLIAQTEYILGNMEAGAGCDLGYGWLNSSSFERDENAERKLLGVNPNTVKR